MIILQPITSNQTISIMPRVDLSTAITMSIRLRRDGDAKSETITNAIVGSDGNFTTLSLSSSILSEGSTYFMEIEVDDNLAYRDKIFCTSQNDYTVKHEVSKSRYIQPTGEVNDNTYII
jgi:hypothetical protein